MITLIIETVRVRYHSRESMRWPRYGPLAIYKSALRSHNMSVTCMTPTVSCGTTVFNLRDHGTAAARVPERAGTHSIAVDWR